MSQVRLYDVEITGDFAPPGTCRAYMALTWLEVVSAIRQYDDSVSRVIVMPWRPAQPAKPRDTRSRFRKLLDWIWQPEAE